MTRELPKGWVQTTVGSVCQVEYGKSLPKKQRIENGQFEVYGSAGLVGHHNQPLLDEPVVIVGRKGNAGAVWHTRNPCWPIDTTYFLRVPEGLSVDFLGLQLGSINLVKHDSSTTIPSLRRPDLEATTMAIAPSAEQERIVTAVEEHFSRLDAVESVLVSNPKIGALRRSILREAFSGRLVPQDPDDEPASALLERIHASHVPKGN